MKKINNVNDILTQFSKTRDFETHSMGFNFTKGIGFLAETYQCWWLIKDIVSFNSRHSEQITHAKQVWVLKKSLNPDYEFTLTCTSSRNKKLFFLEIPYSNFEGDQVTIYYINRTVRLPCE